MGTTAEDLMRARYTAFVRNNAGFIVASTHPARRPEGLLLDPTVEWLGLEVLETEGGNALETTGTVRFRVSYRVGGQPGTRDELSRFERVDGTWYFVESV
ncbi:MAG: YchJ family metal-binding protein [Actinomycetota bacterium]